MTFKQQIYQQHILLIQDKIDIFRDMIMGLAIDAQNDAKGSAGDKHETALSMMHIEQEKLNYKLQEFLNQKAVLEKINPNLVSSKIGLGSIVKVNDMYVFISSALPKIKVGLSTIIAISAQSPLGIKLLGNEIGFQFEINGSSFTIFEIY